MCLWQAQSTKLESKGKGRKMETRVLEVFDFDNPECWEKVKAVRNEPIALRALDAGMSALCRRLKKIKVTYTPCGNECLIIIGRTTA
jgi:hypothetical protein